MITLDAETHIYSDESGQRFTSVSKVINTVIAKSFEGVDQAILDNAADRGKRTENYATEILRTGGVTIATGEREDVVQRVEAFWHWFDAVKPRLIADQQIVSHDDICGSLDFLLETDVRYVVDLKCTSQAEKSWALQLGAYMSMEPTAKDCAVLHLNPKYKNGWIWRAYDPLIVKSQWRSALEWYRTLRSLKVTD